MQILKDFKKISV